MRAVKPKFYVQLFIYKRLRNEKYLKSFKKRLLKHKTNPTICINNVRFHSHCQPNDLISTKIKNINPDCKKPTIKGSTGKRFYVKFKSWHLPPNRYTLPIFRNKCNGPFFSKLQRTEETIISHERRMKELGEFKIYDTVGLNDKINSKCYYYKGVFTSNPRERKPTVRSMIHDSNYTERSPTLGPTNYYPNNHCIGRKEQKKPKPLFIYKFLPNSTIPITETSITKNVTYFGNDPTAYYPYTTTVCPIVGKCDPDMAYKIEVNNLKRSRRLPYNKLLSHIKVESDFEKNITGHGHTSKFQCPAKCDHTKILMKKSTKELSFNYHTLDYIRMIVNPPNRKIISFRDPNIKLVPQPMEIKYMATQKPVLRKKLLETANLAFNSTQPRWKDDTKIVKVPQEPKKVTHKNKVVIKHEVKSRLYDKYPDRRTIIQKHLERIVSKIRQYKFAKEPPAKLLIGANYVGDYGTQQLQHFLTELPHEMFFRSGEI